MDKLGERIKELRQKNGLTQEQLAEKLSVTAQAVSKWENGSNMPDISMIVPICNILGVSADRLLGTLRQRLRGIIERMKEMHILFEVGMTEEEIAEAEKEYQISFSEALKEFYMLATPVSPGFVRWNDPSPENRNEILRLLTAPAKGLYDAAEHGWKTREEIYMIMGNAPRLIPIFRHRYIPMTEEADAPVLSVAGRDIIYYGRDLCDYLIREFIDPSRECDTKGLCVPVWDDLVWRGGLCFPNDVKKYLAEQKHKAETEPERELFKYLRDAKFLLKGAKISRDSYDSVLSDCRRIVGDSKGDSRVRFVETLLVLDSENAEGWLEYMPEDYYLTNQTDLNCRRYSLDRNGKEKYIYYFQRVVYESLKKLFLLYFNDFFRTIDDYRPIYNVLQIYSHDPYDIFLWDRVNIEFCIAKGHFARHEDESGYEMLERCACHCELLKKAGETGDMMFGSVPMLDRISERISEGKAKSGIFNLGHIACHEFDRVRDTERFKNITKIFKL